MGKKREFSLPIGVSCHGVEDDMKNGLLSRLTAMGRKYAYLFQGPFEVRRFSAACHPGMPKNPPGRRLWKSSRMCRRHPQGSLKSRFVGRAPNTSSYLWNALLSLFFLLPL